MGASHLANVLGITAVATERCHQDADTGVMRDEQPQHDVVEVLSMLPTLPSGDVDDRFRGLLIAVGAPIDVNTGAIEMRQAGRECQALRSGRGHEAVEFGHAIAIEGIQGPTEGVIVAWPGSPAGRQQSGGGLVLEEAGHKVARLGDQPPALEHHRVDRFTHGQVPHCRIVLGGLVDTVATAAFVDHASDKAEGVQDLATVRGLIG
jgi:hypothetical protein